MASQGSESVFMSVALLLNRLTFGGVVLARAMSYLRGAEGDLYGHQVFYRDVYKPFDPGYLPAKVSMYYGYLLPYAGLLSVLVIVGIFTRLSAGVLFVLLTTVLFAMIKVHGMPSDAMSPEAYVLVLAGLALLISAAGPGRYSLDTMAGGGGGKKAGKSEPKEKGKE